MMRFGRAMCLSPLIAGVFLGGCSEFALPGSSEKFEVSDFPYQVAIRGVQPVEPVEVVAEEATQEVVVQDVEPAPVASTTTTSNFVVENTDRELTAEEQALADAEIARLQAALEAIGTTASGQ